MTPTLLTLLLCEIAAAAVVWTGFVVHYQFATHGRWRTDAHGRNVMSLAVCLAVMVNLTLFSAWLDGDVLVALALALWPALAAVGLHRHLLLWRDQRHKRHAKKEMQP